MSARGSRRRLAVALVRFVAIVATLIWVPAAVAVAPRPAGWPATLPIGLVANNGPYSLESAADQRAAEPGLAMRYVYLSGDATGSSDWTTYDGGNYVPDFIADSQANGFIPVFTFYQVCESGPAGCGPDEQSSVAGAGGSLQATATMAAVFGRLKHFFQQASGKGLVVLHVEPDTWGFIEATYGDSASDAQVQVAATGMSELAGLPNTAAGFAQAVVHLRDLYAPNVQLAYQLSDFGTGTSVGFNDDAHLPDSQVQVLAARSAAFEQSLGARWDLMFAEFYNQDAAYADPADATSMTGPYWWDASDYARQTRYLGLVSDAVNLPIVLWQIPLGNTIMRAMDNTPRHYQDNRVQTLLGEPGLSTLRAYVSTANVIGLLFGAGIAGQTCACDASIDLVHDGGTSDPGDAPDGVTNPAAINGNTTLSYNADDDGGYFGSVLGSYAASPITLPVATVAGSGGPAPGGGGAATGSSPSAPQPGVRPRLTAKLSHFVTHLARGTRLRLSLTIELSTGGRHAYLVSLVSRTGRRLAAGSVRSRIYSSGRGVKIALVLRVPRSAPTGRTTLELLEAGKVVATLGHLRVTR